MSVAIEGDTAILGARSFFGGVEGVFAFVRVGPGAWSQLDVPLPEGVSGTNFGISVDISGDSFIVGATHADFHGAAWLYARDSGGDWAPVTKLTPSDFPSSFGAAVRLEGSTPFVGAWADSQAAPFAGSAYVFPDMTTSCPADFSGDGVVAIQDLLALLASWGTAGADLTGDGTTSIADLLELLAAWGPCG